MDIIIEIVEPEVLDEAPDFSECDDTLPWPFSEAVES